MSTNELGPSAPLCSGRSDRTLMSVGVIAFLGLTGLLLTGCRTAAPPRECAGPTEATTAAVRPEADTEPPETEGTKPPEASSGFSLKPGQEVSLFDGKTLGQWKITDFGGQGDVYVKDGAIYLEMGSYTTGITWTGPVIRMNYEVTLEAMRVEGNDFFCALTFPVAEKPCTLVLGGWGGTVCGLSNIDFYDASENLTTRIVGFDNGRWYKVRLRVLPDRIRAWLDDEELVDVDTTGRHIDIRPEVDLSQPLGIATWVTTGAVRNIRLKELPAKIK